MSQLSAYQKSQHKLIFRISFIGGVLGLFFVLLVKGVDQFFPFVNGFVSGFLIGFVISVFDVFVFAHHGRKMKFIWYFLLRLSFYVLSLVALLMLVAIVSQMFRLDRTFTQAWNSEIFKAYLNGSFRYEIIFIIVFAGIINFTRLMSKKLGQGVLQDYVRGTYHSPKTEYKVFMFLQIIEGDQLLKKLGPMGFHKFLNRFYFDLTTPVLNNQGVIYEYVEDLVVITWKLKNGVQNEKCVELFYAIQNTIEQNKIEYLDQFGFIPEIKAALHCGTVIGAEIGEIKTQIVYQGDTLNTTARILNQCEELDAHLLISEDLRGLLDIPSGLKVETHERINLRGKNAAMNIYAISQPTKIPTYAQAI